MACSCAAHNNPFVLTFKSLLDSHYQVSSLPTFSNVSLVNCSCIFLFTQVLFKFLCILFFKFFTRYSIFNIGCLSCSSFPLDVSSRIGNIKFLFFSSLTQHSTLIRSRPPIFPLHVQSVHMFFRCNAPYISFVFFDFLPKSFNLLSVYCNISA